MPVGGYNTHIKSLTFVMIVVSAPIRWSPIAVSPYGDKVDATDMGTGFGVHVHGNLRPRRQLKCFNLFACPLNPLTPPFGHAVRGGLFGSQCGAACLCATDSLITNYVLSLKEKLPQTFMQIGWMEVDFRNLIAKVWANLDNPIKRYDFSNVSLNLCMSPSQVALL